MEKDPVCGMQVDPRSAAGAIEWEWDGKTYYFCSVACQRQFEAGPEKFVHSS